MLEGLEYSLEYDIPNLYSLQAGLGKILVDAVVLHAIYTHFLPEPISYNNTNSYRSPACPNTRISPVSAEPRSLRKRRLKAFAEYFQ
jgi:hypothetical protein